MDEFPSDDRLERLTRAGACAVAKEAIAKLRAARERIRRTEADVAQLVERVEIRDDENQTVAPFPIETRCKVYV